ncbi:hypothetical protein BJV82DRAFT_606589 [Fennellomyces sp. T-0311]|nr:hypothetical protein BJV82DRAFT_606589 [Fennellomyces sp. T-0311]
MSTTATIPAEQEVSTTRGYKSFLKPGKFWQRSTNKVSNEDEKQQGEDNTTNHNDNKKTLISMPTAFKPKSMDMHQSSALRETAKAEIYKLSTINDSGVYLPPSPAQNGKRDHWIELDEEALAFRLPSPECLTTYGSKNKERPTFYTPSAVVMPRSSSVDTTEDDVPSLMTDLSSAQSSSNVF